MPDWSKQGAADEEGGKRAVRKLWPGIQGWTFGAGEDEQEAGGV